MSGMDSTVAGDVAQRVQPAVRRGQPRAGRADHAAGAGQHGERLVRGERGAEAGDRLELVQGAAGVAEAAPGQLRHGRAARRDQRRQDQADLVADPAGRVLVHGGPGDGAEVEPVPGVDHGRGPGPQLGAVQAAEVDRHQQRGHLLVGDLVPGVGLEQPPDVVVGQPLPVPLGPDEGDRVGHRYSSLLFPAGGQVGAAEGGREQHAELDRAVRGVDEQAAAAGLEQQLAAAAAGQQRLAVARDDRDGRPGPRRRAACRAETRPHSAHRVRPKEAFSTLQPVTTCPSAARPAAPTRSPE